MPYTAYVQCTVCGHSWTFPCPSEAAALERLRRTNACPGRRCHPFKTNAVEDTILEVLEDGRIKD